mgnify:CR=1 FL=1
MNAHDAELTRKMLMPFLAHRALRASLPSLLRLAGQLGDRWVEMSQRGELIKLQEELVDYSLRGAAVTMGAPLDYFSTPKFLIAYNEYVELCYVVAGLQFFRALFYTVTLQSSLFTDAKQSLPDRTAHLQW